MSTEPNQPTTPANVEKVEKKPKKKGEFRLFKRDDAGCQMSPEDPGFRERPYYFKFECRGKGYLRCLDTNDSVKAQAAAKKIAAEIKEAVRTDQLKRLDGTKIRQTVSALVSKLIETYTAAPVDASKSTRLQNCHALKAILKAVYQVEDPTTLPCSQVNGHAVRKWFELAKAKVEAETEQGMQLSLKVSANSRMNQASGLFTAKAMAAYKDAGIYTDAFQEFYKSGDIYEFSKLPKKNYNPPSDLILKATLDAWEKLDDRDLFLAIGHELSFGLRAGELGQAKWSWWTVRSGYPVLDGRAEVKNGSAIVQVRALDPFFTIMKVKAESRDWRGQPDDYIIRGSTTARTDDIFRRVSDWLRNLGWQTNKTNHALRAYSGSQIAMKFGIYEAQTWLRHSSVNVTESNYSHFVKTFKPEDPDKLPVKWAIHTGTFEPRVFNPAVNQ